LDGGGHYKRRLQKRQVALRVAIRGKNAASLDGLPTVIGPRMEVAEHVSEAGTASAPDV